MTQPFDRNAKLPAIGPMDRKSGEFWVENPFDMPGSGFNLSAFERNRLYLNLDGRSFLDASFASNADIDSDSRSVVAADFDRDGKPDLLVGSVGGGPLRLFHNRFEDAAKRARIELVGTESNRRGIGARVVAEAGGRRIVRDVFPFNPGMGQAPPELILGLGDAKKIDRLEIRWPSGQVERLRNLPVDATLTITEGSEEVQTSGLTPTADAPTTASN